MSLKRDVQLLFEIGCFRYMQRVWKRFLNPDVQNNAEHTLRVAWLALLLAKQEKATNLEKILQMALLHDLPESRTGDVDYVSRLYTVRDEHMAEKDIFAGTSLESEMGALWEEYEQRTSLESHIVKDADTLDVDFEIVEQTARGHQFGSIFKKQRKENVFPTLYTKSAKKLWQEIYKTHPHEWHLTARNRMTAGDWKKK